MSHLRNFGFAGLLAILAPLIAAIAPTPAAARRLVLAIAQNVGDAGQVPLRFAESDARAFVDVLRALGDVRDSDVVWLPGATADSLRATLAQVSKRLDAQGWGASDQLFVYVSAHAADGELRLAGTRFSMGELRTFVEGSRIGVGLLIADTCQAAWITRRKGLEPLDQRTVTVERPQVSGRVYVASSGPTESSVESDGVGGSYFTQHLIAALRGAGDASHDGRVTLQEAFVYAYNRTVESSIGALGGGQTPRYEMELAGQRDLVLTELSRGRGLLTLQIEAPGNWVVTPLSGDAPAVRLVKAPGPVVFSVEPGTWRVRTRDGDFDLEGEVNVEPGEVASIDEAALLGWARTSARVKGAGPFWTVGAGPVAGTGAVATDWPMLPGAQAFVRLTDPWGPIGRTWYALDAGFRRGPSWGRSAFDENEVDVALGAGWGLPVGGAELRSGLQVGAVFVQQTNAPHRQQPRDRTGTAPRVGVTLGTSVPLAGAWSVELRLVGGAQQVTVDGGAHVAAYGLTGLALTVAP